VRTTTSSNDEKLIRVLTTRRGNAVELRVHYEKIEANGCLTYRLFSIEDAK